MKQLVMRGPMNSAVEDRPDLVPRGRQVLVKVKYCGICMSEHYTWETASPGTLLGHEPVGTVAGIGDEVSEFKPGDRVSCVAGEAFSEYVLADKDVVFRIPDTITDEDAIIEPLICMLSAAKKLRIPDGGGAAAVVGTGYMGLGAVSLLKQVRGVKKVVAVDIRPEARANALKYGADEAYAPDELTEAYLADRNISLGFELVAEWGETNESLDLAIRMTRMNGMLGLGAYHTGEKRLVDMQLMNVKAIDALNTHPRHTLSEFHELGCEVYRLLESGTWKFLRMPHKIYKLSEFDLAHREIKTKPGNFIKGIVDCTKW